MTKKPLHMLNARNYATDLGIFLEPERALKALDVMERHELTQTQLDAVMRLHIDQVIELMTPQTYRWYHRLFLAFHFLFGRKPQPKKEDHHA